MEDYRTLLKKAREALPENAGNKERWSLPPPDVIKEGRMTILRNFGDLVKSVRRDEAHLSKFLLSQIGTAGNVDGDRLIMTGHVTQSQVQQRLDDYVATYVQCSECGSPDTHLEKDGRTQVLKCEACGAHTPVKARKGARKAEAAEGQIREGGTVEITISKTGSKGQGLAEKDGYTIVVPNAKEGMELKVRITRVTGNMAVGEPIE